MAKALDNRRRFRIGKEFATVHDPKAFMENRREAAGLPLTNDKVAQILKEVHEIPKLEK